MSLERLLPVEGDIAPEQKFETADAIGARLLELGWTEEQLGGFVSAVRTMAGEMEHSNEGAPASKMNFELNVVNNEEGAEVAEVTIVGEGKGLDSDRISKLIDGGDFFMKVFAEADPEFFAEENKVILSRKRNLVPEIDIK